MKATTTKIKCQLNQFSNYINFYHVKSDNIFSILHIIFIYKVYDESHMLGYKFKLKKILALSELENYSIPQCSYIGLNHHSLYETLLHKIY